MAATQSSQLPSLPLRKDFERLAAAHTLVPVYRSLTADLETPVSAFLRLAEGEPECFMLESVEGGERVGRYTFIGVRPYKKIVAWGKSIEVTETGRETHKPIFEGDIFALLKDALNGHNPARIPGLPPFTAGAVGFFAYDVVRQIERLPSLAKDDLGMPDACLMFFDEVLAFDHVKQAILLIVTADLSRMKPKAAYDRRHRAPRPPRKETRQATTQDQSQQGNRQVSRQTQQQKAGLPQRRHHLQGIHRRRRHLSSSRLAALRSRARSRPLLHLPLAAHRQSVALHVLPPLRIKEARHKRVNPNSPTSSAPRRSY